MFFILLISVAAGASIVVARNINSELANKLGVLQGTLINYVVGLIFAILFFLLSGELSKVSLNIAKPLPLWAYLGGFVGVMVVSLSNLVTPKISAFYLTLIIFIGQMFAGIIIDYFIGSNVSPGKIIGSILVVLGLIYNLKLDKITIKE